MNLLKVEETLTLQD